MFEFTVECNFSNTTEEKLRLFRDSGVNRLSFGLETTSSKQLLFLERDEEIKKSNLSKLYKALESED